MVLDKNNLSEQALQQLIDEKAHENKELEYKNYTFTDGKFSSIGDSERYKLVKEIAAFANTNGGIIIIGMKEDKGLPSELSGSGLKMTEFDDWESSFRLTRLSKIRPHLHGVECKPVQLSNGTLAIIIFILKSFSRPHSFWDGTKDEFNIRDTNGIAPMDINDLRKEFLYSSTIENQIREFRRDRISMILDNDTVGNIEEGVKLVIHIIPEWSFELGNSVDVTKVFGHSNLVLLSELACTQRYNIDGYCYYNINSVSKRVNSYVQFLRQGIIEAVDVKLMLSQNTKMPNYDRSLNSWLTIQYYIIKGIARYSGLLQLLSIPKPWHIFISFVNAKGYTTDMAYQGKSEELNRDIIDSIDSTWNDDDEIDEVLKPILNSLSNAFGYDKSTCYDESGKIRFNL